MLSYRGCILVLLGLLATHCATDPSDSGERLKTQPSATGHAKDADNPGERLIAQPPATWQSVFTLDTDRIRLAEFIPADEDKEDWTLKITFESFIQPDSSDPIEILLKEADRYREKCKFVQHFNLFSGLENGYPTSFRLIMCGAGNFSGKGEVLLLKAIQGEVYFYILKLLKRVAAFQPHQSDTGEEEMAEWATYFKMLIVCNDSKDHPCPSAKPATSARPADARLGS